MDNMERRQNEELLEARRLRRQEQKRRLLMRQRVLAVVLLVIVILSLILILRGCRNRREHPELYVKKDSALELQTEPDATVNIAAVGDIMITDDLLADAKQPGRQLSVCRKLCRRIRLHALGRLHHRQSRMQFLRRAVRRKAGLSCAGFTCHDAFDHWLRSFADSQYLFYSERPVRAAEHH